MCWFIVFLLRYCPTFCLFIREEELQLQKLKKRKVKADPRLSFHDDLDDGNEEEDDEDSKHYSCML